MLAATALLTTETYAFGTASAASVTYTYTRDGKPDVRTWARGVATKYLYHPAPAS